MSHQLSPMSTEEFAEACKARRIVCKHCGATLMSSGYLSGPGQVIVHATARFYCLRNITVHLDRTITEEGQCDGIGLVTAKTH